MNEVASFAIATVVAWATVNLTVLAIFATRGWRRR